MNCYLPEFDASAAHSIINDGRPNRIIVHCINGMVLRAQRFIDGKLVERLLWAERWTSTIKRQSLDDAETTYEFYEMER